MEIKQTDVENLIYLGDKCDDIDENQSHFYFRYFQDRDHINRLHPTAWEEATSLLTNMELVKLYKGLIIIEKHANWSGGSVAAAIWVYRIIQIRGLDQDNRLADFGLKNCDNPWIPYGNSYYGVRNIKEYFKEKERKTIEREIRADKMEKLNLRIRGRKDKRLKSIHNLRQLSIEQRKVITEELKLKYLKSSMLERFTIIVSDDTFPPEYYPVDWILLTDEEIEQIPIDVKKKLIDKLTVKTMGHWRRFVEKLRRYDDGL